MMDDLEDLGPRLSTDDAAAFLNRSPATLSRWRDTGEGPKYMKIGAQYQYPARWLKEFLLKSIVTPGEKDGAE